MKQAREISFTTQSEIIRKWTEVASQKDPTKIGRVTPCKRGKPYFIVIFPGIKYEFVFKVEKKRKTIHLMSCVRLKFLDYGQPD